MGHVLGIKFAASEGAGGGNDGTVRIGGAMRRLDFQCAGEDRERDLLHSEAHPRRDQTRGDIVR
jgi:hypothetical protein